MYVKVPVVCRMLLGLAAGAVLSMSALAQQPAPTAEVRVQASAVVKKQIGRTSSGVPVETAVVAMRVGYSDLPLVTNTGQAQLRERVAHAAKDACARVAAKLGPDVSLSGDSECIRTAISDAQAQIDAAIEEANTRKVGARS